MLPVTEAFDPTIPARFEGGPLDGETRQVSRRPPRFCRAPVMLPIKVGPFGPNDPIPQSVFRYYMVLYEIAEHDYRGGGGALMGVTYQVAP